MTLATLTAEWIQRPIVIATIAGTTVLASHV